MIRDREKGSSINSENVVNSQDLFNLNKVHEEPSGQVCLLEAESRYTDYMEERFGTKFRNYRQRWAETSQRGDCGDFPLSLDLGLNSGCQLACIMCPLPGRTNPSGGRRQGFMEEELYVRLMDQAHEHELPALTLGLASEPLLHPHLTRWIGMAGTAGIMDIRLGTNGQLLTPELTRRLLDSPLTRLEVSVDAVLPETYQAIRGADLVRLERAIETFCELRSQAGRSGPLLRLSFLRLNVNEGQEKKFLQRWAAIADMISLQDPIWFPGSALPRPAVSTGRAQAPTCAQCWQRLAVTWDGEVWPCCSWYGEELLNFRTTETPLAKIWNSKNMQDLRASLCGNKEHYPEPCTLCEF